jgi:hypothetical protein
MTEGWTCKVCARSFTRVNQRHACGTGDVAGVLRGRSAQLVEIYRALETYARGLGDVELVARERYVLLRSVRIFADLVLMTTAVRVAVHLEREVDDALFFKRVRDRQRVTCVAKLTTLEQLAQLEPYLREAYVASLS